MSTKLKIKLKSFGEVQYTEGVVQTAVITPGTFVAMAGTEGAYTYTTLADDSLGSLPAVIVVEASDIGDGVDVDYAIGARARAYRCEVGQEFNARFDITQNIAVGDLLSYGDLGQLKEAVTTEVAQFEAIEADAATTEGQLLAVRVISPVIIA